MDDIVLGKFIVIFIENYFVKLNLKREWNFYFYLKGYFERIKCL